MRRAPILAAFALAMIGRPPTTGPWAADTLSDRPDGFDHILHRGEVESKAIDNPSCTSCHSVDRAGFLRGRLDHATCFDKCHGAAPAPRRGRQPYAIDEDRREVCSACHAESEQSAWARGRPGPNRPNRRSGDSEFAIHMSHQAHAAVPQGCRKCHGVPADERRAAPTGRAHSRCVGCHNQPDARTRMSQCEACHQPSIGPRDRPRLDPGLFPVGKLFSHRAHLARGGQALERCDDCHRAVTATEDNQIPAPSKERCRSCHDGVQAFSTTETACRKCHVEPALPLDRPIAERAHFDHRQHDQRSCADCHGEAASKTDAHAPCSDSGCHQPQFAEAASPICTICHNRTEPWLKLHLDPRPRSRRDFGIDFSHRAHGTEAAGKVTDDCGRCHRPEPSGRFGPSRGHAACTGDGCHDHGQNPAMSACDGCHRLGSAQLYEQRRRARSWSVRQRFRHVGHLARPNGAPVPCTSCHTDIADTESLRDIDPPAKLTCAGCHDGGEAFKLTGHTCQRCHLKTATAPR